MDIITMAPWIAIAITLILSVLVPVFTQIANNRFQLKLRELDDKSNVTNRKLNAYEDFFQKVGACVSYAQVENVTEAGASIQRLYAYVGEEDWVYLDKLFDSIKENDWNEAKNSMRYVSKILALDIKLMDSRK